VSDNWEGPVADRRHTWYQCYLNAEDNGEPMSRPPGYTKQIGIRCDPETLDRCVAAGAGRGEVAGARVLLELGWQRYSQAVGLAAASRADRLRAIAAELDEEAAAVAVAPSGAVMARELTAAKIHQLRSETGAALFTTQTGLLLFGLTPEGEEGCFALDSTAGEIGITAGNTTESRKLGELCPAVAALAQLVAGILGRTASAAATGDGPSSAPAGQHPRLRVTVWGCHPDDGLARIRIGDAVLCIHSLQLTALCSELFALQGRLVADAIGQRQHLEAVLRRTPSREETALAWSRTHGE
jgi:hypothetical protein